MGTILAEGLGKFYKRYPTRWSRLAEWLDPEENVRHEKHWVLRDVDFGSAKLIRVRFPGCQFANVDFTKATCSSVDLRGARLGTGDTPGIKAGYDSLSGARIDSVQLMTLAPLLADHLGIKVMD